MRFISVSIVLIFFSFIPVSYSQSYQYVVSFKDKLNSPFSLERPEEFLSDRSINRRYKQGIDVEESDLPISPSYYQDIASISSLTIDSKSKWFNDVVIELSDTSIISKILLKSYVESIEKLPGSNVKTGSSVVDKLKVEVTSSSLLNTLSEYGDAFRQVSMLNADFLHVQGYRGENMRIAVIDAGFSWTWLSEHFKHLYEQSKVIDFYDFVDRDDSIYNHSMHGTFVLSTMASYTPNTFIGTAPASEYILLRSEDGSGEYLLEEYFWTEAAEFADSAGADVINSSLGYSTFDDSLQNHVHDDLDGVTTRISLTATRASERGILVFNSAGNSGDKQWEKITFPADAKNIITVGAVDSSANVAAFSSRGPTKDGRIKPDLMAMGDGVYIGAIDGTAVKSTGTSFSSPVLAGAAACLWQANPDKTWEEVMAALIESADRYNNPDTNYGYGIPDLIQADAILKNRGLNASFNRESITYYPNPFNSDLMILLRLTKTEEVDIEVYNEQGKILGKYTRVVQGGNSSYIYLEDELSHLSAGLYIIKLSSASLDESIKVLKN